MTQSAEYDAVTASQLTQLRELGVENPTPDTIAGLRATLRAWALKDASRATAAAGRALEIICAYELANGARRPSAVK